MVDVTHFVIQSVSPPTGTASVVMVDVTHFVIQSVSPPTGTASVAVAGVIASMRITHTQLKDHTYLFQGAGEVGAHFPNIIQMYLW